MPSHEDSHLRRLRKSMGVSGHRLAAYAGMPYGTVYATELMKSPPPESVERLLQALAQIATERIELKLKLGQELMLAGAKLVGEAQDALA